MSCWQTRIHNRWLSGGWLSTWSFLFAAGWVKISIEKANCLFNNKTRWPTWITCRMSWTQNAIKWLLVLIALPTKTQDIHSESIYTTILLYSKRSWNNLTNVNNTLLNSPIFGILWRWCYLESLGIRGIKYKIPINSEQTNQIESPVNVK